MRLIADCLEDVSRFASGQCEMRYTIEEMLRGLPFDEQMKRRSEVEELLKQAKRVLLPELPVDILPHLKVVRFLTHA